MEKVLATVLIVFALLIGATFGAVMLSTEKIVVEEKECQECPTVEPEIEEVEVEVEKDFDRVKQDTVDLCFAYFIDDVGLDRYQDAEVRSVSDEWSIVFDTRRDDDRKTIEIDSIEFRIFDSLRDRRTDYEYRCIIEDREDRELKITLE